MATRPALADRESTFHDAWAESEDASRVLVTESFESCTTPENRHVVRWLGDVRGLKILDLGCGCGEAAVYFAKRGAVVTACDVSPGMLALAGRVAAAHGVAVTTAVGTAEHLPFPDETFDVVYAANVLHHSDVPAALAEVHRVLAPGGRACFWDPLAGNPAINVYRRMADRVRTPDEHPLTRRDLAAFRSYFCTVELRYFWFATLLVFAKYYLLDRVHPNAERYWKKVIRDAARIKWLYAPLAWIDSILTVVFPPVRYYCWNVVVCARKGDDRPVKSVRTMLGRLLRPV
jgi:SAM-dependent methyltransferase